MSATRRELLGVGAGLAVAAALPLTPPFEESALASPLAPVPRLTRAVVP